MGLCRSWALYLRSSSVFCERKKKKNACIMKLSKSANETVKADVVCDGNMSIIINILVSYNFAALEVSTERERRKRNAELGARLKMGGAASRVETPGAKPFVLTVQA